MSWEEHRSRCFYLDGGYIELSKYIENSYEICTKFHISGVSIKERNDIVYVLKKTLFKRCQSTNILFSESEVRNQSENYKNSGSPNIIF